MQLISLNNFDGLHPAVIALSIVNLIVVNLITIVYLMQHIHFVVSLFTNKFMYPDAKKQHTFAVLIAGRNESIVIPNLIDSIKAQDYPSDKIKIFVCADNCTDDTAKVSREHGAVVFERFNQELVGKSYAMDFLIKNVMKDPFYKEVDAILVFDADNLLSKNYIAEMNKTLDYGYEVSTSFRETKNFNESLVASLSGMTFYRECTIVHHSRQRLGLGTYVSGTGYMISKRIIDQLNGWNFNTLTEDIEFSAWCAINGITVGYNENALFYDEQPVKLKVANKQRLRWCKGTHQCCYHYFKKLLKGSLTKKHKLTCFEMFSHVTPFPIISLTLTILYLIGSLVLYLCNIEDLDYLCNNVLSTFLSLFIFLIVIVQLQGFLSLCKNKYNKMSIFKKIGYSLIFPFFVLMLLPLSYIALFKKVKWDRIPHESDIKIESLQQDIQNKEEE